jgi:hypothetical protein
MADEPEIDGSRLVGMCDRAVSSSGNPLKGVATYLSDIKLRDPGGTLSEFAASAGYQPLAPATCSEFANEEPGLALATTKLLRQVEVRDPMGGHCSSLKYNLQEQNAPSDGLLEQVVSSHYVFVDDDIGFVLQRTYERLEVPDAGVLCQHELALIALRQWNRFRPAW